MYASVSSAYKWWSNLWRWIREFWGKPQNKGTDLEKTVYYFYWLRSICQKQRINPIMFSAVTFPVSRFKHLSKLSIKIIARAMFVLKQVKHTLSLAILRNLYFALIHPHLSYGILVWKNVKQTILRKTKHELQKRAICIRIKPFLTAVLTHYFVILKYWS